MFRYILATVLLVQACWGYAIEPRVTDGHDAEPGEFPYQVSLMWGIAPLIVDRHICGGSILSEKYVLTAGHCILPVGHLKAVAGKHYIMKTETAYEQSSEVEVKYVHEGYKGGVAQHDIALLKLKTPFVFNDRVRPVGIPELNQRFTGSVTLTGWGSISKNIIPILPRVLQYAQIPLLDNGKCEEIVKSHKSIFGKAAQLFDTQVCTLSPDTAGACSGDSGGPLVHFDGQMPVQVGIVSWGYVPCGAAGVPSVFTRVASYADWLQAHMV